MTAPSIRLRACETRYRGLLAKNTSQLLVMFGLSILWMVRKRILHGCRPECACNFPGSLDP